MIAMAWSPRAFVGVDLAGDGGVLDHRRQAESTRRSGKGSAASTASSAGSTPSRARAQSLEWA
jgi:hypothetical protein